MKKSNTPITHTATEFAKMNNGDIRIKLSRFPYISIVYQGQAWRGYEVHPPGTGSRLADLDARGRVADIEEFYEDDA